MIETSYEPPSIQAHPLGLLLVVGCLQFKVNPSRHTTPVT